MHARHLMAAAFLGLASNAALAGPAADDARVHFNAIAGGGACTARSAGDSRPRAFRLKAVPEVGAGPAS